MANTILKTVNERGIPALSVESITSDGTNTSFNFEKHRFIGNNFSGFFVVKIPQAVATSTQPLFFNTIGVEGTSVPVYDADGDRITVATLATSNFPTFRLMFYDRQSNKLQLMV